MLIYWLSIIYGFFSAKAAFALAERKKYFFFVLLPVVVVPLAYVAACRDLTIGRDLQVYGLSIFEGAQKALTLTDPWVFLNNSVIEPGYLFFNLIVASFSNSCHVFFFIHQFFLLFLVLVGIFLARKFVKRPELFFLVYLLFLYAFSFSMLRQSLAIGMEIFAIVFFVRRQIWPFMIACFIGYFFHNSILFFVPFYFLPDLIKRFPKVNYEIVVSLVGGAIYLLFPKLIAFALSLGWINVKYEMYANASYKTHKANLVIYFLFWLVAIVYGRMLKEEEFKNRRILVRILCVFAFFIELCGVYNDVASRLTMYLFFLILAYLFNLIYTNEAGKMKIKIYGAAIIMVMIVFFAYSGYVLKTADLFPYKSHILGIL